MRTSGTKVVHRAVSVFAFLLLAGLIGAAPMAAQSFDIIKVADGVYAAIGKPGVGSNGAFIVNQDDVVVVDTHLRPSWAQELVAEIRKITDKPVRYVINTHWHNDHTQGNQVYVNTFGSNVEYLAQRFTREDIIGKAILSVRDSLNPENAQSTPATIARLEKMLAEGKDAQGQPLTDERKARLPADIASQKAYLEELKQIQITLPTITFDNSLALHKPGRDIHIYFFGKGHTRGDVVVFLPKENVVITGDLLTNGIPFMRDAYPVEWIGTLQAMMGLDWTQAIPGHGGVQQGKEQVGKLVAYMKDLVAAVRDAQAKGMSLEDAQKKIDLSKHAANFSGFQRSNELAISRTWAELSGQIKD